MTVPMKPVYSSHIHSIGYDQDSQSLHVTFLRDGGPGRTVVYGGVPAVIGSQVISAPSIGDALHALVRGRYPHRYL